MLESLSKTLVAFKQSKPENPYVFCRGLILFLEVFYKLLRTDRKDAVLVLVVCTDIDQGLLAATEGA